MEKEFLHQELEVAQAGADIKEGTRAKRIAKVFTTIFFSFSLLLTIGTVVFTICFYISVVSGPSMMMTLNASYPSNNKARDSVLVNKYVEPKRGDIIIVRHYWETTKYDEDTGEIIEMEYFIKRLIGIEGDRIRFEKYGEYPNDYYKTVVNDVELDEPYLDATHWGRMVYYGRNIYNYLELGAIPGTIQGTIYTPDFVPFRDRSVEKNTNPNSPSYEKYEIVIKPGEVFFMGDNRGSEDKNDARLRSLDCTAFGPQQRSLIEGVKADIIYDYETFPSYILRKLKQFFSFKWLF